MKEFGFLNIDEDVILSDNIEVVDSPCQNKFVVANSPELDAQIYASEINFYLKNSADDTLNKAKSVDIMYEARAKCFDMAVDMDFSKDIGKNVILLSDNKRANLVDKLRENGFKVVELEHREIKFLYGQIGEIYVDILREDDEFEVQADFLLVEEAREYMLRQSGSYEISMLDDDEVLEILMSSTPKHHYKSSITYNPNICQYHERRSEHCAKCVEICPSVAILKDDESRRLEFSHIDCVGCGGCVSVCPSGAIDYAKMPREAFSGIAKMYKDKKIIIVPETMELEDCDVSLPKDFLIFAVFGEKFLSEMHLMTLLQESGANLIFFSDFVSPGTREAINLINEIYELKFAKKAIFVAEDEIELRECIKKIEFIEGSYFSLQDSYLAKRENFAKRVKFLVGDEDLGAVKSGEWVRYGKIEIDSDTCTLCLSCVGACNVGALFADQSQNALKFNASLCTTCGYCVESCAERDTIKLTRGEYELKPSYFKYKTLAKDTLFKCVECGKEFATTKSVQKIASIMMDKFINDEYKLRSLYCCSDCKAKLMIKKQLEMAEKGAEEWMKI